MQRNEAYSKLINGISTKELMKNLGISNEYEFNKHIIMCSKLLNIFGLVLRNEITTDKWYLMANVAQPPRDISKAELATLTLIKSLIKKDEIIYIDKIVRLRQKSRAKVINN